MVQFLAILTLFFQIVGSLPQPKSAEFKVLDEVKVPWDRKRIQIIRMKPKVHFQTSWTS